MKKLIIAVAGLLLTGVAFSQKLNNGSAVAGKIKLANGQKIVVESVSDVQASLAMGMELTSNSTTVNSLEVKSGTDKDYTISNTLTKLKVNMNMMGQSNNYDSENKGSNNAEMGKIFDAELLLKIIKEKKEQPAVSSDLLTEDRTLLNELATTAQYLYGAFLLAEKIGNERNIAAQKLIELIKKEYDLEDE